MNEVEKLNARRDELLKEIGEAPLWVNGSVVETTRKTGGKESPFYYLSHSMKGKNKITYISAANLDRFRKAAAEGVKTRVRQHELSTINAKLIKAGINND
jgi:hypothetical protein